MSEDYDSPVAKLNRAIAEYIREVEEDNSVVVSDWFLGYGAMVRNPEPCGHPGHDILFRHYYATSEGSPWGALGVADLTADQLRYQLNHGIPIEESDE